VPGFHISPLRGSIRVGLSCFALTGIVSFAHSGLALLCSVIPRLAPWAVFFPRFAAFCPLPLSMGDCIGSISQNLVELRSTDSRWRLSPPNLYFLKPNNYL